MEVNEMTMVLANLLAGALAVPILQVLKRYLSLSGPPMMWFTAIVCVIIGGLATTLTGQATFGQLFADPFLLIGSGGIVGTVATAVYRTVSEKLGLG